VLFTHTSISRIRHCCACSTQNIMMMCACGGFARYCCHCFVRRFDFLTMFAHGHDDPGPFLRCPQWPQEYRMGRGKFPALATSALVGKFNRKTRRPFPPPCAPVPRASRAAASHARAASSSSSYRPRYCDCRAPPCSTFKFARHFRASVLYVTPMNWEARGRAASVSCRSASSQLACSVSVGKFSRPS
jgi:hypothetical protein